MSPRSTVVARALIALLVGLPLLQKSAAAQDTSQSQLHSLQEVGEALSACMEPLAGTDPDQEIRITVRLGFNAGGQPLGPPRLTHLAPEVSDQTKSDYKRAVSDAIKRCTPLSFSHQLGGLIAGVPLILVFDEHKLIRIRAGGSSAYVAPAQLPSVQIPPVSTVTPPSQPPTQQQPPTWVPGLATPIPNLPHGPETSQDRRTRCMYQSGLYNVPLTNFTQYMGLCTQ
jgi:hypothetical protein